MDTNKNQPATKPRFRRTRIIIQIALFLIPLIFLAWRVNLSYQVDAKLKALQKAGQPTTPAELQERYYAPIDAESNAAIFFNHAFERSTLTNKTSLDHLDQLLPRGKFLTSTQMFSAENNEKLTQLLDENQESLELLHHSPPSTLSRFDLDFELGLDLPLPQLQRIRHMVQLLTLQAVSHAEHHQMDAAIDDLKAALRVHDALSDEPILISQLARINSRNVIYRGVERILGRRSFTETQLLELSETLYKHQQPDAMTRALEGELCLMGTIFTMSAQQLMSHANNENQQPPDPAYERRRGYAGTVIMKWSGFTPRDYNFFLDIMPKRIAASRIPFPERIPVEEALARRIREESRKYFYFMSGMLLPALEKVYEKEANDLARSHMIQIALAIERFRLAHQNKLPEQLDDLVPQMKSLPLDPFTGKNFLYKKLPSGYMLYSVGRNLKDDGGIEKDSKKPQGPDDVTFTVEQ